VLVALLLAGAPALAVDGVIEINQAKALAGAVTANDEAGFPVEINSPGSYRLTSSLTTGANDVNAIQITVSNVSIDLNGFRIEGTGAVDSDGTCIFAGSGLKEIRISNGIVRNCAFRGIDIGGGVVERVIAANNLDSGIVIGSGQVLDSVSKGNTEDGISVGQGLVSRSLVDGNGDEGIVLSSGLVDRCVVRNAASGLVITEGSVRDTLTTSTTVALLCSSFCGLSGNHFGGCAGVACFTGSTGTIVHVPTGSSLCGNAACP
jgi:hypothetical protein